MTPDWSAFTPWSALGGGTLIGLAVWVLLHGNGRIAGISGITGGLLSHAADKGWRIAFLVGLAVFVGLMIWLLPKLWRAMRALFAKIAAFFRGSPPQVGHSIDAEPVDVKGLEPPSRDPA